ncbi:hypothetical protein ACQGFI_02595 [Rhodococcus sp. 2.95]
MSDGVPAGSGWTKLPSGSKYRAVGAVDALAIAAGSSLINPMYLFEGDSTSAELAAVSDEAIRTGIKLVGEHVLRHARADECTATIFSGTRCVLLPESTEQLDASRVDRMP